MQKSDRLTELLDRLFIRINYERQVPIAPKAFKLEAMEQFVELLGNPHIQSPVIHVAGTKGKGSVTVMVSQILTAAGYRTGAYVSPHLETINQRILVDGREISDSDLEEALAFVESMAERFEYLPANEPPQRRLTFFEMISATAFYFFASRKVSAVVLETGLGGRRDSTNVCHPEISIITNISLDHTKQLGDTIAKIAFEKAGIIKPGIPVVSGALHPDAAEVIAQVSSEKNSRLLVLNDSFRVVDSSEDRFSIEIDFPEKNRIENIELALEGPHQRINAAIAVAAIHVLRQNGWKINEQQIRDGLKQARLPGRTEIVSQSPTIMLDIAHNPASIEALMVTLNVNQSWIKARKRILVMSISRDKDAREMIECAANHFDYCIFTKFECNPRAREPEELMEMALNLATSSKASPHCRLVNDPQKALDDALSIAGVNDFICVAGSAFLVADLRPRFVPPTVE